MSNAPNKWSLLSLLVGLAAGAAAGILLAPKSGKDTRADLKKSAQHAKDEASGKFQKAKKDISKKTKKDKKKA